MIWEKLGLVFNIPGKNPLMRTHAQRPVVIPLDNDRVRVYFSSRDEFNRSRPFFFEAVISGNRFEVTYLHETPLMELGEDGTFDDSGIIFSSWIQTNEGILMYYNGFSLKKNVPYETSIGLAKSRDGVSFSRVFLGPVLSKNQQDIILVGLPNVALFNNTFYLFYFSGDAWIKYNDRFEIHYDVKLRTSNNPNFWCSEARHILKTDEKHCFAPSCIVQINSNYYLFLSGRGTFNFRANFEDAYKIYYMVSTDLISWSEPKLVEGLQPSGSGFDSIMAEYFYCFNLNDEWYGLYNGDGFGKSGIGLAKLIEI